MLRCPGSRPRGRVFPDHLITYTRRSPLRLLHPPTHNQQPYETRHYQSYVTRTQTKSAFYTQDSFYITAARRRKGGHTQGSAGIEVSSFLNVPIVFGP
jgi:hypothetical protein